MTPLDEKELRAERRIGVTVILLLTLGFGLLFLCQWAFNSFINGLSLGPFEVGVRTWRDDNRDGVWDAGEPAVAYVNVHLEDVVDSQPMVQSATDESGVYVFGGLLPPGSTAVYEVYAEAPPGYEALRPERVRVDSIEAGQTPIDFGFALLPGWPTPTPRPTVVLDCQLIFDGDSDNGYVEQIQSGADGSVILTLRGVAEMRHYAADGTFLEVLPAAPNLPTDRALVGPDGRVWTWGGQVSEGLAVFDGQDWRTVAPYDHPTDDDQRVYDAAIAADGALWLGTDLGALRLDEATGQWTRHASYKQIEAVVPTPDGTIWLLQCARMAQCTPTLIRLTPGGPRLYEESTVATFEKVYNNVDGASYDGAGIWVVNDFGLDYWDIATAEWTPYTPETTNNALPPTSFISQYDLAPDGTFWLAVPQDGFVVDRLQFGEQQFAFIRARPQAGEWHFASSPLIDGQTIGSVVVAGDGSVWANLRNDNSVYRCE